MTRFNFAKRDPRRWEELSRGCRILFYESRQHNEVDAEINELRSLAHEGRNELWLAEELHRYNEIIARWDQVDSTYEQALDCELGEFLSPINGRFDRLREKLVSIFDTAQKEWFEEGVLEDRLGHPIPAWIALSHPIEDSSSQLSWGQSDEPPFVEPIRNEPSALESGRETAGTDLPMLEPITYDPHKSASSAQRWVLPGPPLRKPPAAYVSEIESQLRIIREARDFRQGVSVSSVGTDDGSETPTDPSAPSYLGVTFDPKTSQLSSTSDTKLSPVKVTRKQFKKVLSLFLKNGKNVTTNEALIDAVWGEEREREPTAGTVNALICKVNELLRQFDLEIFVADKGEARQLREFKAKNRSNG